MVPFSATAVGLPFFCFFLQKSAPKKKKKALPTMVPLSAAAVPNYLAALKRCFCIPPATPPPHQKKISLKKLC